MSMRPSASHGTSTKATITSPFGSIIPQVRNPAMLTAMNRPQPNVTIQ